jgi:hypothetical protein
MLESAKVTCAEILYRQQTPKPSLREIAVAGKGVGDALFPHHKETGKILA